MKRVTYRSVSIVLFVLSVVVPAVWLVVQYQLFEEKQFDSNPYVCGLIWLGELVRTAIVAGLVSLLSLLLSALSLYRLRTPRPWPRYIETTMTALPFLSVCAFFLYLTFGL